MRFRSFGDSLRGVASILAPMTAVVALASCGGGGGSGASYVPSATATQPPSTATQPPTTSSSSTEPVTFTITWPNSSSSAASAHRVRSYISPSTKSVTIAGTGFTTVVVNNPNVSSATAPAVATTVSVFAPVGADTFTVTAYDAVAGTGHVLSENAVGYTVVMDQANAVSLTLNGDLAKMVCAPVSPYVYDTVAKTNGAYTQVGPTGQIVLMPEDADGNVIVGPGTVPTLGLAAATASQATITPTSGVSNEFNTNLLVLNTAVSLTGTGTDVYGNTVTTTAACTDTRVPALYVTNRGPVFGSASTITVYPASATGAATPTATLSGAATDLVAPSNVAVDPAGNMYVANQGPLPGATFAPISSTGNGSGYISIYGPGPAQSGNQAPIGTIPNLNTPEQMAFDTKNNFYTITADYIFEYAPGVSGALASPTRSIGGVGGEPGTPGQNGNVTDLFSCYGLALDASNNIYTACSDVINMFAATAASGYTAPTAEIELPTTQSTAPVASYGSYSWLSIAVDASGNIYVPAFNQQVDAVDEYPAGTSGTSTAPTAYGSNPTNMAAGGFVQPYGIFIDSSGYFYVSNFGSNSVEVFDSTTALTTGAATATISGTGTGLNFPEGVFVR